MSKTNYILYSLFLFLSCKKSELPPPTPMFSVISTYPIQDLTTITQNANELQVPLSLLSKPTLIELRAKAKKHFYAPWHQTSCQQRHEKLVKISESLAHSGFGENFLPHSTQWGEQLLKNANYEAYGSICMPGILVQTADLRALPTMTPHFDDPNTAGNGYPFDNLQNSQSPPGTPVMISHYSKDKAWVFVEDNEQFHGWVLANTVSTVFQEQVSQIESLPLAVVTEDQLPMYDQKGDFLFYARLGMYLPVDHEQGDTVAVKVPIRLKTGPTEEQKSEQTQFITCFVSRQQITSTFLEFTENNIRKGINDLINKPYGWGTYLGNRDCSALVHDFYSLFGVWLPRNSRAQATAFGKSIELAGKTNEEKLALLHQYGIPYQTLLFKSGHIVIYIGEHQGKPLIFHAPWGVPTRRGEKTGRNIIGKSAITTLEFGKEITDFDNQAGTFLQKMEKLVVLDIESGPLL